MSIVGLYFVMMHHTTSTILKVDIYKYRSTYAYNLYNSRSYASSNINREDYYGPACDSGGGVGPRKTHLYPNKVPLTRHRQDGGVI